MISSQTEVLSRQKAQAFADRWKDATNERQDAQSFWREFFTDLCEVKDLREAGIEFEKTVINSLKGSTNWIDVFWKDTVLIEHKSSGKNLDEAENQARGYLVSLPPKFRPPMIVISDFKRIRVIDVLLNKTAEFNLADLPNNLNHIEIAFGLAKKQEIHTEVEVDAKAASLMAALYQEFEKAGYQGHEVSVFMVRILFLLFGEDTRMFQDRFFTKVVESTSIDGGDLGGTLQQLFQVLDTEKSKRPTTLDYGIADSPYVNGGLFAESLPIFNFTHSMREALVKTTTYDWSGISPAIFGSMFQMIKSKEERRALGEHYTSERNIHRVIDPLILDELNTELEGAWDSKTKLNSLRKKLANFNFLDPACGCGNFLVVTYKAFRQLELEIIKRLLALEGKEQDLGLDGTWGLSVKLSQFHGIEIEEWSSQIATVAMFLADHQENIELEKIVGSIGDRFPLSSTAQIRHANALDTDWENVCPMNENTVIMGNPPFLGSLLLSAAQKEDQKRIWSGHKKSGIVDFVTNWYLIAAKYIQENNSRAAFVSTSSIAQGEQPAILWGELKKSNIEISFAHSNFAWNNDASGMAAVSCVIIGLAKSGSSAKKKIWIYSDPKGEGDLVETKHINSFLVPGADITISSRSKPLNSMMKTMYYGSMPRDNGHLSKISGETANEIRSIDPVAAKYLYPCVGADEVLNGGDRYALWLEDASPKELNGSAILKERIAAVRKMRSESNAASTQKAAETAHLWVQRAQPKSDYIAVPGHSSENRSIIPFAYYPSTTIATNALLTIEDPRLSTFALLQSSVFSVWTATVSGRLESRIRISAEITYHNFPIPNLSEKDLEELKQAGKEILDARAKYPDSTLSDMYQPGMMPLPLLEAHKKNDKINFRIFGIKPNATKAEILSRLFELHGQLTEKDQLAI